MPLIVYFYTNQGYRNTPGILLNVKLGSVTLSADRRSASPVPGRTDPDPGTGGDGTGVRVSPQNYI